MPVSAINESTSTLLICIVLGAVPTFISFLRDVDNPYEVKDYVNSYLGENAKSAQFAKEFIERRSIANKQKHAQQRMDDEVLGTYY